MCGRIVIGQIPYLSLRASSVKHIRHVLITLNSTLDFAATSCRPDFFFSQNLTSSLLARLQWQHLHFRLGWRLRVLRKRLQSRIIIIYLCQRTLFSTKHLWTAGSEGKLHELLESPNHLWLPTCQLYPKLPFYRRRFYRMSCSELLKTAI
jgi:hypothetical protein